MYFVFLVARVMSGSPGLSEAGRGGNVSLLGLRGRASASALRAVVVQVFPDGFCWVADAAFRSILLRAFVTGESCI